jgi:hypothetical protein
MIDKYESHRIRVEIRRVLLEVWDPIGIKDEPNAQSEYDGYLGDVYKLPVGGATDSEIIDRLLYIVHGRMGLERATPADMIETVSALRKILLPPQAD